METAPAHAEPQLTQVTDAYELLSLGYPAVPQRAFIDNAYPCIFKIGNEFFDFTPFKLASNVWPAYWVN